MEQNNKPIKTCLSIDCLCRKGEECRAGENKENWKKEFYKRFVYVPESELHPSGRIGLSPYEIKGTVGDIESFIYDLIAKEKRKAFQEGYEQGKQAEREHWINQPANQHDERIREEERQFILNILDGIDMADEEMGNKGGGTKAIRLALKSRIINNSHKAEE